MNEFAILRALSGILNQNQANGALSDSDLKKALTTASGFAGINLEPSAKMLLPIFAGLRNRLPSKTPKQGAAAAQWRAQLGFGAFAFGAAAAFGTANGAVGAATAESATTFAADYKSLSINGDVQWEAIQQALGWDNAMSIDTMMALSLLLRLEELSVLYGNAAALTMTAVTVAASTLATTATFSNATWKVRVTAITGQGALNNASANSNVGESAIAEGSVAVGVGGCQYLDVSWPYVPGAVGYKVYLERVPAGGAFRLCDPATDLRYAEQDAAGSYLTTQGDTIVVPSGQTYVTVNRVQIVAIPDAGDPAPPGANDTANSNMFEGILAWCLKNTVYGTALPFRNVVDMAGMQLTTHGTGILEFDRVLKTQWETNQTSPSLIICSSNSIVSAGNRIAGANNGNQLRLDVYGDRNKIVGGLYVGGYVNKFASGMAGMQTTIDMWAHPYMPDGTFLFISEDIPPETYPYAQEPKAFALDVQTPYTYLELGRTQRSFPYAVFYTETLECYWPNAQSAIVGARVDS